MRSKKQREFEKKIPEIIKTLKEGPDFGIHGTNYENLESILKDSKEGKLIRGYYFAFEKKAKQLPDIEFYEKLEEDVRKALHFSEVSISYIYPVIDGDPCLILGVDNRKENSTLESPIKANEGVGKDDYYIGHNFKPFLGLDIHPLTLSYHELNYIYRGLVSLTKKERDYFEKRSFGEKNLAKLMINKIYEIIKTYKK